MFTDCRLSRGGQHITETMCDNDTYRGTQSQGSYEIPASGRYGICHHQRPKWIWNYCRQWLRQQIHAACMFGSIKAMPKLHPVAYYSLTCFICTHCTVTIQLPRIILNAAWAATKNRTTYTITATVKFQTVLFYLKAGCNVVLYVCQGWERFDSINK